MGTGGRGTAEFKNVTFTSLYVYIEHHVNVDLYSETTFWEQKQQSWKKFTTKNLGGGLISFPTTFSPSLGMVTITG